MARRKKEEENIRTLFKSSRDNSYSISLPVDVIRAFDWQNRQKLELEVDEKNKQIIIKDWKSYRQR
ncbi:MAG: hypothetical protein COV70_01590 [Parcubacteria group bacterium CG11_big_fil_rev_8_21_14_0_20_39_22]|nr:MAG: hypothetical protein COV70_01590 [Parcubacteria group bacterium CG11_big_fil_rev_8_21_14_0_20_39_22]